MNSILENHVDAIHTYINIGLNNHEIVERLNEDFNVVTSETSIRRFINTQEKLSEAADKRKVKQITKNYSDLPGVEQTDESIVITLPPTSEIQPPSDTQVADILARRNLNPDEWEVKQMLDNQWEANSGNGHKITLYQFKIWLAKKTPIKLVFPPTPKVDLPEPKVNLNKDKPILVVVCGDHQVPHIEQGLHNTFLQWVKHNKPDVGVLTGDLVDWNTISRHKEDPGWDSPLQDTIQSAFDILYSYRKASTDTDWTLIKGNHDSRLRDYILERADKLYGITPAQYPGDKKPEWVFSLAHLLNLDKLKINYVETKGSYEFEQVKLSDALAVRHGHYTSKDASLKTAVEVGHNIVLGHTHSQSIRKKTLWDSINEQWNIITAIETGCMCKIFGGIGFANAGVPDWHNGFVAGNIWPDGKFTMDLATYEQKGVLRWRDQVFTVN